MTTPTPDAPIYIGRPSAYGNPFKIGRDGDRAMVVAKYREWFYAPEQEALRMVVRARLRGRELSCPGCRGTSPCHGDILKEYADDDA